MWDLLHYTFLFLINLKQRHRDHFVAMWTLFHFKVKIKNQSFFPLIQSHSTSELNHFADWFHQKIFSSFTELTIPNFWQYPSKYVQKYTFCPLCNKKKLDKSTLFRIDFNLHFQLHFFSKFYLIKVTKTYTSTQQLLLLLTLYG